MLSLTHRETESAFSSSVCTGTTTTLMVASSQVLRWWFSSILAGPVRMLGVGYREVNQDQSSDPLALFRTSKAYSFLFSQYTLIAISAVSPDTALYMCVTACACVWKELRGIGKLYTHTFVLTYSVTWFLPHTRLGAVSLISHLLTQGVFWGSRGQRTPTYSCLEVTKHNWQLRLTLKGHYVNSIVLRMCLLVSFLVTFGPLLSSSIYWAKTLPQACMKG